MDYEYYISCLKNNWSHVKDTPNSDHHLLFACLPYPFRRDTLSWHLESHRIWATWNAWSYRGLRTRHKLSIEIYGGKNLPSICLQKIHRQWNRRRVEGFCVFLSEFLVVSRTKKCEMVAFTHLEALHDLLAGYLLPVDLVRLQRARCKKRLRHFADFITELGPNVCIFVLYLNIQKLHHH